MKSIFESKLPKGYLDLYVADERLYALTAFSRAARGICLEVPPEEAADLTEALLRHLDEPTRASVIESVSNGNKNPMVGRR